MMMESFAMLSISRNGSKLIVICILIFSLSVALGVIILKYQKNTISQKSANTITGQIVSGKEILPTDCSDYLGIRTSDGNTYTIHEETTSTQTADVHTAGEPSDELQAYSNLVSKEVELIVENQEAKYNTCEAASCECMTGSYTFTEIKEL